MQAPILLLLFLLLLILFIILIFLLLFLAKALTGRLVNRGLRKFFGGMRSHMLTSFHAPTP
jgi:hypothetical protein